MYVFLGFVPHENAVRGKFDPVLIMSWHPKQTGAFAVGALKTSRPIVVNNITDRTAVQMLNQLGDVNVRKQAMYRVAGSRKDSFGILFWYECDIYARPNGRLLLAAVLSDRTSLVIPEPTERLLSSVMSAVPYSELLTETKPVLAQRTAKTEKEKEKKHEELVC